MRTLLPPHNLNDPVIQLMKLNRLRLSIVLIAFWLSHAFSATVIDSRAHDITLPQPATRIISLAPHVTELLFAAGAGEKIIATVSYSNFPEAANSIPLIGSYVKFDFERILAYKPDLIVGWESGNPPDAIAKLEQLGLTVFLSEPRKLADIAGEIHKLGTLADTEEVANRAAEKFLTAINQLIQQYQNQLPVTLFYQMWHAPLMTLNGEHLFSDVVKICGGVNVFADLKTLAPRIDVEAVLQANPDVILASGMDEARPEWLDEWHNWPQITAVNYEQLYFIHPDLLQRHSPRIAEGARQLCQYLDLARKLKTPENIARTH